MIDDHVLYIPLEMAIKIHQFIIEQSGGLQGITDNNKAQLDSILSFIQNDDYYKSFSEKLSFLSYAVAKDHIFNDGNKRTAIALGAQFMMLNGYDDLVPEYIRTMENYIVWTIENRITRDDLSQKITYIISDVEEPEEFKLNMFNKLNL